MTKHQACANCQCDFVGPDANIGLNFCESCWHEIHGDCGIEIERLGELVKTRDAELQTLRDTVDKLPVDAEGKPVIPIYQDLWHPDEPVSGILRDEDSRGSVEFDRGGDGDWHYHKLSECYSTEAIAKAAGGA